MKKKVAIIGAGIAGISLARILKDKFDVTVFENQSLPGGMIKCENVNGYLFHNIGGHVFNSKRTDVLNWFWSFFDKNNDFLSTDRNASILLSNKFLNYPIEDSIYQMDKNLIRSILKDLLFSQKSSKPKNLKEFLKFNFGKTLYQLYFEPYNKKIWNSDLEKIPLPWLEGKLPMPNFEEILYSNITREGEKKMVHSSFFYPSIGGSQFIVDTLSKDLNIICNSKITSIEHEKSKWYIHDKKYEKIFFTGNIKYLPELLGNKFLKSNDTNEINKLKYHGTTTVLCQTKTSPYSWIYLPDKDIKAHRIINTGNFSPNNNPINLNSCTIEFSEKLDLPEIEKELLKINSNLKYIKHSYNEFTYPIQTSNTRKLVENIKLQLEPLGFFILGRFAEWEYYNMDAIIGKAIDLSKKI